MNPKNNHNNFASSYKLLNPAQKEAVDTIDGPVLVVAGPGTGKTQLLALRVANILDKTDTLPQNILCLTFTEVGARNMRERIANFIGQPAYDVRISTYHGFGSDIIRENNEYFLEYGDSQPIDKIGQHKIMNEIYDKLSAKNILWRSEVYLKDALSLISECKRADLKPENLVDIAKINQTYLTHTNPIVSQKLFGLQRISKSSLPIFENLFIYLQKNNVSQRLPGNLSSIGDLLVTSLAESLLQANETGKTNPITKWKNDWLAKDSKDNWIISGLKETEKLLGLADIYQKYNSALINQGLFDYDDMILRAIHSIEQNDDLRFSLQEKYQYIMLDEFQDTNLSQLKLIELLTNNPASENRPNILAVGDDDQAIYSFQGADLTNMLRFRGNYKNVSVITLTENWRSHSDVLSLASAISNQIEDRLHNKLGFKNKNLIAKNPKISSSHIVRHNFNSDLAELAWVANNISQQIISGVSPSEIAVLAPKHKYLEPLVGYLNKLDIPIRYDKREDVFEDRHIQDLLNMANLVVALSENNHDTANALWPIVLSGDQWDLPTSTIWKISWQSNKNNRSEDQDSEWQALMMESSELKPIALFFTKLSLLARTETLETIFDYLIGTSPLKLGEENLEEFTAPYFEYYFGANARIQNINNFEQLLSNLTVLRQKLRDYKKGGEEILKLSDFIEFYQAYNQASEKLLNTSPYHSSENAVQLLTAYGSKGLEFGNVYILATLDDVWGMKARGNSNKISLPKNLQIIKRAGQSKDERKRLFFVALSRAKHALYLTSHSQNYGGKNMTWLEFLNEYTSDDITTSPHLPTGNQQLHESDLEAPLLNNLQTFWHSRHSKGAKETDLIELLKPRLETFQLSATDLNHFTDLIYGGPESFLLNKILKFPKGPTADGQYGNAMHETMEVILNIFKKDGELPDTDQVINIFGKKLKTKKLSKDDFIRQLEKGEVALSYFMPEWWPNFNPSAEAEYSFRQEGCFVDDAHLSGMLDQIIVDHDQKTIEVIDFKTGKPHNKWNSSDAKLHKYRQQLLFYQILVSESHSFKNYDVVSGRLVFVEHNDDKLIDELGLEYSKEIDAIDRTKKLIKAVWKCIMDLQFPDVSEYDKTAKGIKEFEDWLIESYS